MHDDRLLAEVGILRDERVQIVHVRALFDQAVLSREPVRFETVHHLAGGRTRNVEVTTTAVTRESLQEALANGVVKVHETGDVNTLSIENLGVGYVMSMLKAHGHQVDLIFDPGLDDNLFVKFPHLAWMNRHEELLQRWQQLRR